MKVTFLGQAGLLFESENKKILVDPYLSNSVAKTEPNNERRVAVDERFFDIKPDVILCTHCHGDHFDKETLVHYLTEESEVLFLAPYSTWKEARKFGGANNNYVAFNCGTTWTFGNFTFTAVKAEHSDSFAIGVIISDGKESHYVTGDTLYNEQVFSSLPKMPFDYTYLPINGKGNNMNIQDAIRFSKRIDSKFVVPVHFGLFDDINPKLFAVENAVIPIIYKTICNI